MKFYKLDSGDEGSEFFATKSEALKRAREITTGTLEHDVTVDRVELADTSRASIVALANQRGWCSSRVRIWPKGSKEPTP